MVGQCAQRSRREERPVEAQDGRAVDFSRVGGGRNTCFTNAGASLRLREQASEPPVSQRLRKAWLNTADDCLGVWLEQREGAAG